MKKNKSIAIAAAMFCMVIGFNNSVQAQQVKEQFFILPAPGSPNFVMAGQNDMAYMMNGGNMGFIDNNIQTNPAALNMPNVLRGCQICFGPTNFLFWDGTNNPTGAFSNENGSWIGWGFKIAGTNMFLASDVTFNNSSTDPANALGFSGNVAINSSDNTANSFGTFLRGQVWNGNQLIADYHKGESVTNPITCLVGIIRVGWSCSNPSDLANDLNYFKTVMEMTNVFAIQFPGGGATNQMSSIPYLDEPMVSLGAGNTGVNIEGQRHLGLYYNLFRSFGLNKGPSWTLIGTNMSEGTYVDLPVYTNAFYRASESGIPTPAPHFLASLSLPRIVVDNGSK